MLDRQRVPGGVHLLERRQQGCHGVISPGWTPAGPGGSPTPTRRCSCGGPGSEGPMPPAQAARRWRQSGTSRHGSDRGTGRPEDGESGSRIVRARSGRTPFHRRASFPRRTASGARARGREPCGAPADPPWPPPEGCRSGASPRAIWVGGSIPPPAATWKV